MKIHKYKLVFFLVDALIVIYSLKFSFWYVNYLRGIDNYPSMELFLTSIVVISITILFRILSLYKIHTMFDSYYQFVIVLKSLLISYGILFSVLFILKHPLLLLRREIIASFFVMCILLFIWRIVILKYSLRYFLRYKIIGSRVVLIGAGDKGQEIVQELVENKHTYFTPVGFLDDYKKSGDTVEGIQILDIIGNINKYSDRFDEILITLTNVSYDRLQEIIDACRKLKKPIHVISDLYRIIPEKLEVEKFDGFSTFYVPPIAGLKEYFFMIFKRMLDYTVALLIILLFLPFWVLISIMIKIGSPGPIFYKTTVIGYKEKPFIWYKFRTMYINNDDTVHRNLVKEYVKGRHDGQKIQNDPRITSIGTWLRQYSIDEFPQLINVLKGQMSLVGPRPVLPYEYDLLDDWQKERFAVLSGMTGLWQVHGRNKVNFADQHVLDLYYVRSKSIMLDLEILFNTISVVLSGRTGV